MDNKQTTSSISGFHIPYEVRETAIGKGLFTTEKIHVGALIWEYKKGVNINEYNEKELRLHIETLDFESARRLLMWSPFLKGVCCEILDDGHLMNHSDEPNCVTRSDLSVYALRDI